MTCRGAVSRSPAFASLGVTGSPAKSQDFVGRGGATKRADFGTFCPKASIAEFVPTSPEVARAGVILYIACKWQ